MLPSRQALCGTVLPLKLAQTSCWDYCEMYCAANHGQTLVVILENTKRCPFVDSNQLMTLLMEQLQRENAQLRALLDAHGITIPADASPSIPSPPACPPHPSPNPDPIPYEHSNHNLSAELIERYSRQIILPCFGVHGARKHHHLYINHQPFFTTHPSPNNTRPKTTGQAALHSSAVLIIGAGGLGCPVAQYLAASGIGRLGIVDRDAVDRSNLHRQVLHRDQDVGLHKALSAAAACRRINPHIVVETHTQGLTPANAVSLVSQYDVVVDASDNPPTRYLVNDACVVCAKPLVFGAAIGTDGQLTVYNHGPDGECFCDVGLVFFGLQSCCACEYWCM